MNRSEPLSRSVMLICFATAALLMATRWRGVADSPPAVTVSTAPADASASSQKPWAVVIQGILPLRAIAPNAHAIASASPPSAPAITQSIKLVVDLSDRTVSLYDQGKPQATYPIAVGQAGWETPLGDFQVEHMEEDPLWQHPITRETVGPGPANPLGTRWIGFWSEGEHKIGFHGTNQPELIGQAVSHGCIRMHEEDIRKLYPLVAIGTPVIVQP